MKIFILFLSIIMSQLAVAQLPSSGKLKIYKLQSNYIEGVPSSTGPGAGEGIAIVDSNGLFIRKVTVSALGLPSGTLYRLAKFTAPTTLGNTTSLVDSVGFYGFGQVDGSGLQNARFNFTTQNSSTSGIGVIIKNSNGDAIGTLKNTGSFVFGITSSLNWDEAATKLTANSPFQFGTTTNQPLYFIVNGSILTALDASAFTVNVPIDNISNSYTGLSNGTTAQRPSATFARIRGNSDSTGLEYADGSAWQMIASRSWVRSNFGGSATTLYNGDGTLSGSRTVTGSNNSLTFDGIFNFRVNANSFLQSKTSGGATYSTSVLGSANLQQFGYTPVPTVYSKGSAIIIDTNNNVGFGTSASASMPLYATGTNAVANNLLVGGSQFDGITAVTGNVTLDLTKYYLRIDASGGNITITLPAASTAFGANMGIHYVFKRIDNSVNTVTVQRAGSDTIDGGTSITLLTQYEVKELQCSSTSTWDVR